MVDFKPFATGDFKSSRVESELLEDRRVNIRHIVPILRRVETDFVSRTMDHTAANRTTG